MRTMSVRLLATGALALSTACLGSGQSSASYMIPADTLNNGVGDMSSASYKLSASLGDAVFTGLLTSTNFKLSPGFRAEVSASPAVLNLLSVVSKKLHGATPFEITIDRTLPITGLITVEPRAIGAGHTLVFHFDNTVTSIGIAKALDALTNIAGDAAVVLSGQDAIVTLTNVNDNKRLTVTLTSVNGAGPVTASMGFLVGDVNNTRSVNSSDISGVKARSGQATTALNFQFDVNATGAINSSDISAVKARSGLTLP